jgi:hypothetical protein
MSWVTSTDVQLGMNLFADAHAMGIMELKSHECDVSVDDNCRHVPSRLPILYSSDLDDALHMRVFALPKLPYKVRRSYTAAG